MAERPDETGGRSGVPGDGQDDEWVGLLSEDGLWRWDGTQWQPATPPEQKVPPGQEAGAPEAAGHEPGPTPEPFPPGPSGPSAGPAGGPASEERPLSWPTPWGGPLEDPRPEPRRPVGNVPPLTRASLFGRGAAAPAPGGHEPAARPAPAPPPEDVAPPASEAAPPDAGPPPDPAPPASEGRPPAAYPFAEPPPFPEPQPLHAPRDQGPPPFVPPAPPPQPQPAPPSPEPSTGRPGEQLAPWHGDVPAPPVPAPQPGQAPPPTAAALTSERMLRQQSPAPESGVRRALFRVSGGRLNLGPSRDDQRRRQLLALVRTRVNGCRRIAVISRKGGIGKTTTTLMLGHQFASVRGDRVVALDANPDAGSLADRVLRETDATVTDVLRDGEHLIAYSDVRRMTSQAPSRLEIVASDNDPRISDALGEDEYARVMHVLSRHYSIILSDTGTGILDSATRGILNMADQVVLCAAPSLDASRVSALTLDWLDQHGYEKLAREAVVAINAVRQGGLVELDRLQSYFERRCRAVVRIPWDPRLSAGAETTLEELSEQTRTAYLNLAAMVAAGFAR